jgi:geranylgeranyl diphosphate synthase type II
VSILLQLKAHAGQVDARLRTLLPFVEVPPSELHAAMRYSCLAPGKRLRPLLCMATAEAFGREAASVLDAACALEMVHCFSLIHDDLPPIDNDDLRRGMPTLHRKFGEGMAILAGDALFALAFESLSNSLHPAEKTLRAVQVLTRASGSQGLVGGEVVDVLSEGKAIDSGTLDFIHRRKTGALIAASCEIGAILSEASDDQIESLRSYGEAIGLAFQIADDVLNETGSPEALGKSSGSDRERQKATYPALFGLPASRQMAAEQVELAQQHLARAGVRREILVSLAQFSVDRVS